MSKQSKQYESMRQTQTNTFSDGLNMDLHPLTTPNTILTDCVNGTMITYNDNEFVLQNERGNTKIDKAALTSGFIPVAMKEHGGIIYIVSYNPQTKENEIGTFPSPKKSTIHNNLEFESNIIETEECINYSEFTSEIQYYDYNLIISNYDKYELTLLNSDSNSDPNPLIILEHFILDKNNKITKVPISIQEKDVRFQHYGEGILGYKYRPYYISNFTCDVTEVKSSNYAKLFITCDSDDEELYNNVDVFSKCEIKIFLVSEDGESEIEYNPELEFTSGMKVDINWNKTNILNYNTVIPLQFEKSFKINETPYTQYNTYVENENDKIKYNKVKIIATPLIEKDGYTIIFDNLRQEISAFVEDVFVKPSSFTKFQYNCNDDGNGLTINATLDFQLFDRTWNEDKKYNVSLYSSYKLWEILENKIIGVDVKRKYTFTHNIVSSIDKASNALDWIMPDNEEEYSFKGIANTTNKTISIIKDVEQLACIPVKKVENAKKVAYEKTETGYYAYVLDDNEEIIVKHQLECNSELLDLIDEEINNKELNLTIENVPYEKNKFYLLELTLNINNETYKPSFIIVTDDYMLSLGDSKPARMDEILLKDWFHHKPTNVNTECSETYYTYNNSKYNKLPLKRLQDCINGNSTEKVDDIIKSYFLRFEQLYSSDDINEVPGFKQIITTSTSVETDNVYSYIKKIWTDKNEVTNDDLLQRFFCTLSLKPSEVIKYKQTSKKRYLWEEFNNQKWELPFTIDECGGIINESGSGQTKTVAYQINDEWFMTYRAIYQYKGSSISSLKFSYLNMSGYLAFKQFNIDGVNKGKCYTTTNYVKRNIRFPYFNVKDSEFYDKGGPLYNGEILEDPKNLAHNFCFSAQHLYYKGLRGMMYSNIKENHADVVFNGDNKKLWIYGKGPDEFYNLVAISLFNDGDNDTISKKAWFEILKHGYIITSITPKDTYQYKYSSSSTDGIEYTIDLINNKDDLSIPINVLIYPVQCYARFDEFDVQSLNNLNTSGLEPEQYENFKNYEFDDWDEVYEIFLKGLGDIINKNTISENSLQRSVDKNEQSCQIHFDWNEPRFSETGELNDVSIISPLNMYYDNKYNVIYITGFPTNSINRIHHDGGCSWDYDEYTHLKWSYGIAFPDFWNITTDALEISNNYYSLDFYRSTNYGKESS